MTLTSNPGNGNSYALAFLRIGVGILFLIFGQYKVFGTAFTLHGGFQFWINKCSRHPGAFRKFLRSHFYAHDALLFGLSRRGSGLLAILRREPEPFGVCALLRRVSDCALRLRLVGEIPAEKSRGR